MAELKLLVCLESKASLMKQSIEEVDKGAEKKQDKEKRFSAGGLCLGRGAVNEKMSQ